MITQTETMTLAKAMEELCTSNKMARAAIAIAVERHGLSSPMGQRLQALSQQLRRHLAKSLRQYRQARQKLARAMGALHTYHATMWLRYLVLLVGRTLGAAVIRVMLHGDLAWRERAPPGAPTSRLALPTVPELIHRQ